MTITSSDRPLPARAGPDRPPGWDGTVTRLGDVAVLRLNGLVDAAYVAALREAIVGELELVLDLDGCTLATESVLAMLADMQVQGTHVALACARLPTRLMLERCERAGRYPVHESVGAAVDALRAASPHGGAIRAAVDGEDSPCLPAGRTGQSTGRNAEEER